MFATGYLALNQGQNGSAKDVFDNTNQKIIQNLKNANKKVVESAKTTINTFKIQTKQFKLQQIQTKALTQMSNDVRELIRMMKDDSQKVSYAHADKKKQEKERFDKISPNDKTKTNSSSMFGLGGGRFSMLKGGLIGGVAGGITATFKKIFGAKGLVGKLARFAGKAFIFTKIIDAGYSIFNSYKKASEYFDTEFPTMSQKISAGIGGALESLSFGFLNAKKVATSINKYTQFVLDFFDKAWNWIKSSNIYQFISKKVKLITESEVAKNISSTLTESKDYWSNTDVGKSVADTYNQTTSFWSKKFDSWFGDKKVRAKDVKQPGREARAVVYSDKVKLGGSKAWRNNNPGNITGMSGLRYGAVGIAHSKYGDKGDHKQLIFKTREDGVRAFDQLIKDNYTGGSIRKKFAKYQTKGFESKLKDWEKNGIDTTKDISYYMENEPEKYKKFREIMFRHEGEIPGQVKQVASINKRDINRYHLDPDSVREFKVLTGVM